MQNTYIHIGYPKCASTYLQDEIFPQLGNYSHIVRAPNAEKYYPFHVDFSPERFREYVQKHIQNPRPDQDHLLVSFEDWCELLFQEFADALRFSRKLKRESYDFNNTRVLDNLKLAYPDAHIIIIIREQISWINSRYKMLYRGATTFMSIDDVLKHPLTGYDQLIELAQARFGKDNVTVIPFERIRSDKSAFIRSITSLVNPEQNIVVSDKAVNIAPALRRTVEFNRIKTKVRMFLDRTHLRILYGPFRLISLLTLAPLFWLKYKNSPCPDPCVTLPESLKKQIEATNRNIERLTGLNLKALKYL